MRMRKRGIIHHPDFTFIDLFDYILLERPKWVVSLLHRVRSERAITLEALSVEQIAELTTDRISNLMPSAYNRLAYAPQVTERYMSV